MTQIDTSTEAVEALLKDVTEGPWEVDWTGNGYWIGDTISMVGETYQEARDVKFIAASRELVPALLAERDALKAKLAKAVEAARELMDAFYINGNVTERHYRACQAGVKLETTLAELKGDKDEDS